MNDSPLRATAAHRADAILRAAIAAADPYDRVMDALRGAPELHDARHVRMIAAGKAACRMAAAAREALGDRIAADVVVVPHGTGCAGALHAAHPLPDDDSVRAAHAVARTVESASGDTVILVLLSGGASSLMTLPVAGIDIGDYADCIRRLQRAGADIVELNTVRRHIDRLKGGGLARLAAPRPVLGLILSDVVGDPVDIIASGPLSPHDTTPADALDILRRRGIPDDCAPSVGEALLRAASVARSEARSAHARTVLVGGNATALDGAAAAARAFGCTVVAHEAPVTGEAVEAGRRLTEAGLALRRRMKPDDAPACIIAGGETVVTVRGGGSGGRNQELVLAAALALDAAAADGITIASAGTDGIDGTSDAAGAIADAALVRDARAHGIDARRHLEDNDSDGFFRRAGGRFVTGPTGTNVMDVQLVLVEPPAESM